MMTTLMLIFSSVVFGFTVGVLVYDWWIKDNAAKRKQLKEKTLVKNMPEQISYIKASSKKTYSALETLEPQLPSVDEAKANLKSALFNLEELNMLTSRQSDELENKVKKYFKDNQTN